MKKKTLLFEIFSKGFKRPSLSHELGHLLALPHIEPQYIVLLDLTIVTNNFFIEGLFFIVTQS